MSINVTCHDCERRIELDERPESGKIKCPTCRSLVAVPEPGETVDKFDKTYALPEVKPCPKCRAEMPPDAKICINCGYNFRTGKQTAQVLNKEQIHRSWMFGAIPVFYTVVDLDQTKKGEQWVATTHHLLGIPLGSTEIDLRKCDEIWTDFRQGFGAVGWTIMLLLCLLCVIPGLFWWGLAFGKPNYILRLPHRKSYVTLYEGWNERTMRDILDTLREIKQLEIVRK
jgi:ribosomal protein L40E